MKLSHATLLLSAMLLGLSLQAKEKVQRMGAHTVIKDPKEIHKFWTTPNLDIPEDARPVYIDSVETWDELVVNPETNDLYPGSKPWLVFFYKGDCQYSQFFKSDFEAIA